MTGSDDDFSNNLWRIHGKKICEGCLWILSDSGFDDWFGSQLPHVQENIVSELLKSQNSFEEFTTWYFDVIEKMGLKEEVSSP